MRDEGFIKDLGYARRILSDLNYKLVDDGFNNFVIPHSGNLDSLLQDIPILVFHDDGSFQYINGFSKELFDYQREIDSFFELIYLN